MRPIKRKTDQLLRNAGQKYCRMLSWSILQYFQPSLSYCLSLRPVFYLFLSGRLRQVLLYRVQLKSNFLWSLLWMRQPEYEKFTIKVT